MNLLSDDYSMSAYQNANFNSIEEPKHKNHPTFFNERKLNIINQTKNYKVEAATILKSQISHIINDEIKAYRIQKKMEKQLEDYKKIKQSKDLIQNMHTIQKFRQHESEILKSKLQKYIEEKQKKQSKILQVNLKKKIFMTKRKSQNEIKVRKVQQRHYQTESELINNRLSRVNSYSSKKSISMSRSKVSSISRCVSSAQYHRHFITQKIEIQQKKSITNYLNKMKLAENRILQRQIKNEQRKSRSIKTQIKNLTNQRNIKQQQFTKKVQDQYNDKMGSFYQNITRYQLQNSTFIHNKSIMKLTLREKVLKNKQNHEKRLANRIMQNFNKKNQNKQNIRDNYKKKLDLLRTKSSYQKRSIKFQKQVMIQNKQKKLKILYEKMMKIRRMKSTQLVSQKQKQQILSLIDNQDPQYNEIVEFLTHTRSEFMRKKIQKQEQKVKNQKAKKTARFTNKV